MNLHRRDFLCGLAAIAGASAFPGRAAAPRSLASSASALAEPPAASGPIAAPPGWPDRARAVWANAMAALERHGPRAARDRLAIADFGAPSAQPRLYLVDLEAGKFQALHVTHGSGSDPGHTGLLQSFSDRPGSNATSQGAFVTRDYYTGRHGHSQRLEGLDPTNCNALDRAIVLHSAWYAEPDVLARTGKLGRSQGCLAFSGQDLARVFGFLGEGRLIYSGKAPTA
ncbi:murein L,D-transpeptidase catalytic domain family protein [Altererythrobacter lauratis]|uniref:Murein L,D-transpeptidase catalytic domain family protein n=1 Tax=Alteraurantiacibacter lauratis TaxID=2054627 RepID=A0ABV7EET4_9SPHN